MTPTRAPAHLSGGRPSDPQDFILQRRHRLARRLLPPGNDVLLDFGCGNGAQSLYFAPEQSRVLGVDVHRGHLREFRASIDARELGAKVLPVRYDGSRLPLADGSVDRIISFEVLEHVAEEATSLAELARVLRPGGWLALSVPNRWWIFETHGADLPVLPWNRVPFFGWLPKAIHDRFARARNYRRQEIARKITDHGFRVRHSLYITAPMDVVGWEPLQRLLRRTVFRSDSTRIPLLATAVLVVAQKPAAG